MFILRKLISNIKNSVNGLYRAIKIDNTFKLEVIISPFILFIIYYFFEKQEILILYILWFILIIIELINTAIEKTIDLISLEKSTKINDIKDISSAAVFIAFILFCSSCVYFLII